MGSPHPTGGQADLSDETRWLLRGEEGGPVGFSEERREKLQVWSVLPLLSPFGSLAFVSLFKDHRAFL